MAEIAITGNVPYPHGYYLVYRQDRSNYPPLAQFQEWIGAQACDGRSANSLGVNRAQPAFVRELRRR